VKRPEPQIPMVIIEQASAWLIALREPDVCLDVRRAFADWLSASPVHIQAYLEVVALWTDLTQVRQDLPLDVEAARVIDLAARSNLVRLPYPHRASVPAVPRLPKDGRPTYAWAAVATMVTLLGGWIIWQLTWAPYSAAVGEQRVLTLDDGSVVTLNSGAKIRVRFSRPRREVELLQGQVFFQVAKDAVRPFIVRSGTATVRDLGTEFNVFHKPAATVVTVVEGTVQVAEGLAGVPSGPARPSLTAPDTVLSAGQQLTVTGDGTLTRDDHPDVAAVMSWLHQELFFDNAPLGDVVEVFNQYTRKRIVITDPTVAALHINAVFHSTRPDSFLRYVKRLEGVDIEESPLEIRIGRRAAHP
jgi:transmembrane sensor